MSEEMLERIDRVAQAMGMVSIQADTTLGDALEMIADQANDRHCTIEEIATAVVDRRIRFGT